MAPKKATAGQPDAPLRRSSRIKNKPAQATTQPAGVQKPVVKKAARKRPAPKPKSAPAQKPQQSGLPHDMLAPQGAGGQSAQTETKPANNVTMANALKSPYNRTVDIGGTIPIQRTPSQSLEHLSQFFGVDVTTLGAIATHFGVPLTAARLLNAPVHQAPQSHPPVATVASAMGGLFRNPQPVRPQTPPSMFQPSFPLNPAHLWEPTSPVEPTGTLEHTGLWQPTLPMFEPSGPVYEPTHPMLEPTLPIFNPSSSMLKPPKLAMPVTPFGSRLQPSGNASAASSAGLPPGSRSSFVSVTPATPDLWSTTTLHGSNNTVGTPVTPESATVGIQNLRPRFDGSGDALMFEPRSNIPNFNDFKPMPPDLSASSSKSSSKFSTEPDFIAFHKRMPKPSVSSSFAYSPSSAVEPNSPTIINNSKPPSPTFHAGIPNPISSSASVSKSSSNISPKNTSRNPSSWEQNRQRISDATETFEEWQKRWKQKKEAIQEARRNIGHDPETPGLKRTFEDMLKEAEDARDGEKEAKRVKMAKDAQEEAEDSQIANDADDQSHPIDFRKEEGEETATLVKLQRDLDDILKGALSQCKTTVIKDVTKVADDDTESLHRLNKVEQELKDAEEKLHTHIQEVFSRERDSDPKSPAFIKDMDQVKKYADKILENAQRAFKGGSGVP